LAGSRSRDVAFIIEVSGFQEAAWKQDLYRVEAELRADGFAEADISEAVAFASRRMDLMRHAPPHPTLSPRGGEGRVRGGAFEELEEAQQRVRGRPWFEYVHYCDRKHFESGTRMVGFDPGPCWEQVCCPVLAIYGEKDTGCSAQEQVAVIRRGLQKAGNRDVTLTVFPRAGHLITVTRTGGRKEAARRRAVAGQDAAEPDFAPGYLETMSGWLTARFIGIRGQGLAVREEKRGSSALTPNPYPLTPVRAPPAPPPAGQSARGTASSLRSSDRSCGRTSPNPVRRRARRRCRS
jgi:hypothetical protein